MFVFLVVLILIVAGLLILAVLVQNSKKEGLGNAYLGGAVGTSQLIGVKKTSDLLEQITWGLVVSLFVLSLFAPFFMYKTDRSGISLTSPNVDRIREQGELSNAASSSSTNSTKPTSDAD